MHNVDIRNISFGQLLYFVKVAETGNISKSADYFNLVQSTLSKKLKSMEEQLELQLFIRMNNKLILTPAGKYLYERWRMQVNTLEADIQYAHLLQSGYQKSIVVACLDSFSSKKFVVPTINNFKNKYTDVLFRIETDSATDIRMMLLKKEADVIFTILYDFEEKIFNDIQTKTLGKCEHMVCMNKNNPLAYKKELQIIDLKQSQFICISPHILPEYTSMIHNLCSRAGFTPNITNYVASAGSLALNLIQDNDIFICDKYYLDQSEEDHVRIPLKETSSGFVLAWWKDNKKPYLKEYVNSIISKYE